MKDEKSKERYQILLKKKTKKGVNIIRNGKRSYVTIKEIII